ncbi:MAG: hypothetical protein U1E89_15520 [Burkholderiaceae bacterium]
MTVSGPGAYRSKAWATWLAVLGGAVGAHRFYLHGARDALAWLHPLPTLAGLAGVWRMRALGQDDVPGALLVLLLGLMITLGMASAIAIGLTPDERWNATHNPGLAPRATRWAPVLGAIVALMVGGAVLMSTIAFGGQRWFEWQRQQASATTASG